MTTKEKIPYYLFSPNYHEPFICPYHNCYTDNGWCWECAVETYGYDKAKEVYNKSHEPFAHTKEKVSIPSQQVRG